MASNFVIGLYAKGEDIIIVKIFPGKTTQCIVG